MRNHKAHLLFLPKSQLGILTVQCLEGPVTLTELETQNWSKPANREAWYKDPPGCHQDLYMEKSFQFGGLPQKGPLRDHHPLNFLHPNHQIKICLLTAPPLTWIFRRSKATLYLYSQKPRVKSLKTKIRCYPLVPNRDTLSTGNTCCLCLMELPMKTLSPETPRNSLVSVGMSL